MCAFSRFTNMYSDAVAKLITEGSKYYAVKDYEQAATSYADACAAFNEENGSDDADLLLLYGKALFQNGVAKSGVLGAVGNDEPEKEKDDKENEDFLEEGMAEEAGVAQEEEEDQGEEGEEGEQDEQDQDDQSDNDDDEAPEEEQTDFEVAWEILDLARSLFAKQVEELEEANAQLERPLLKSDAEEPKNAYTVAVQKLSEVYDLLGEVSLESENFPQAAVDIEACLDLRKQLYDASKSSLVSESHYKLSLALEFCVEDPTLRLKAAAQMKSAIDIVKAKDVPDEKAKQENAELLRDLEERYSELKRDPQEDVQSQQLDIIKGLLGEAVGGASVNTLAVKKKLPVNDLSSMVKKRKSSNPDKSTKKAKK